MARPLAFPDALAHSPERRCLVGGFAGQWARTERSALAALRRMFRSYTVLHDEFVAFNRLSPATPFLMVSEALRCVSCGAKEGGCRAQPYGIGERREGLPARAANRSGMGAGD